MEKNPIINRKYLPGYIASTMLPLVGAAQIMYNPNAVSIDPAKISPNITPNKNGKVTAVKTPGLASLNLGVSY